MAIDFGRMFKGIATGYLGAKIENTAANDRLKANIMESAGQNFFNNVLPEAVEQENTRKENYNLILSSYKNPNVAELADINGFTADKASMSRFDELMKANKLDAKKLEGVVFDTDYNTRYNTRAKSFEEKYQPILNQIGLKEIGGLGYNTVETLVGDKKPAQMQTQDVASVPPEPASTKFADYLTPMTFTYQVDSKKFAAAAQPFGFQGSIKFDSATGEPIFNLPGTLNTKYRALFNATNDVAQNYIDDDNNVNIGLATEAGSKKLYLQTEDTINNITKNYTQVSSKGITQSTAEGFTDEFNSKLPSDEEKKAALKEHLIKELGSKSEQQYFAESFPTGVKFASGQDVKQYLLNLTNRLK